jgi:small subunit ribosomal protein S16
MLKIRLQRVGKKGSSTFRLVLTDSHNSTKSGRYLEVLGNYDPRTNKPEIKGDRIKEWMSKGAGLTDTVHNLLIKEGVITGKKINVLPKKTVPKKEEAVAPEAPVAAEVVAEAPEASVEAPADATPAETPVA